MQKKKKWKKKKVMSELRNTSTKSVTCNEDVLKKEASGVAATIRSHRTRPERRNKSNDLPYLRGALSQVNLTNSSVILSRQFPLEGRRRHTTASRQDLGQNPFNDASDRLRFPRLLPVVAAPQHIRV